MKTLSNIIDELGLSYDELLGLLEGNTVREIPSINVLSNLATLLKRFSAELDTQDKADDQLLTLLNTKRPLDETEQPDSKKRRIEKEPIPVPVVITAMPTPKVDPSVLTTTKQIVAGLQEAARELGLWNEQEPDAPDRAYNCRKFGVALYPENDLQDYLPGKIPEIDFSKSKPPNNQVQFTTFQAYIELYFRPFSNSDLEFLEEKSVIPPGFDADYDADVTPYLIPKLGEYYADIWEEEDSGKLASNIPPHMRPLELYHAKGTVNEIVDDHLYTEEVQCGPLLLRLLSAVLLTHESGGDAEADDEAPPQPDDEVVATQLDSVEDYKVVADIPDFNSLEERLRRELKYIGIFTNLPMTDDNASLKSGHIVKKAPSINLVDNPEEWLMNREDDEVCGEMRELQRELRQSVERNQEHRKRLMSILEDQLAYQEYSTILEDLDKQVDQAYVKRLKQKNKKKKATQAAQKTTPELAQLIHQQLQQQQAANLGLRALLDKRLRWISNIGKLFPPPEVMKRVPKELVFTGVDGDDDVDEMTTTTDMIRDAET